jgi:hypothetical protein
MVRKSGNAEKRFDLNIVEGEIAERTLADLIKAEDGGLKLEVKRDFRCSQSGNVAVEVSCSGRPSGITATESEWVVYFLEGPNYDGEVFVGLKTSRLRELCASRPDVPGGDGLRARMKLLRIWELLSPRRDITQRDGKVFRGIER